MSAALQRPELPPEAIQLIKEGSPKPLTLAPAAVVVQKEEPVATTVMPSEASEEPQAGASIPATKGKGKIALAREAVEEDREALVSVSFRLPQSQVESLLRASLDRKVKRARPFTQQEIMGEALAAWLKRAGY